VVPDPPHDSGRSDEAGGLRSLRRKLAKLQKAGASEATPPVDPPQTPPSSDGSPSAILYRRDLPREAPPRVPAGGGICIPLEQCVDGVEVRREQGASLYFIERSVTQAEPGTPELPAALARALDVLARRAEAPITPDQLCFLDIETTGLGTALVFLIGTLVWREGDLVCRQFLARTYAEEASILEHFAEEARRTPFFVTFNGKTFDVPSLRVRAAAAGVPFLEPPLHFDLLHAARRRFKDTLPDCKLQTLERRVCQRYRGHDIAGSDIGRAYHDFVRSGDAREIAQIVEHNQWDLVTMVHLIVRILLAPDA